MESSPLGPGTGAVWNYIIGAEQADVFCENCKAMLINGRCDCDHCDTCNNAGHIEVDVWYTPPKHMRATMKKKETTWCPDCEEGEVWKELLN